MYPSIKPQERPAFIGGPFSGRRRDNPATCSHPHGAQTAVLLYVSPSAILIPSKCVAVVPQLATERSKQIRTIILLYSNQTAFRIEPTVGCGPDHGTFTLHLSCSRPTQVSARYTEVTGGTAARNQRNFPETGIIALTSRNTTNRWDPSCRVP